MIKKEFCVAWSAYYVNLMLAMLNELVLRALCQYN